MMIIGSVVVSLQGGDHCFDHRFVVFPQRLLAPTDLTEEISDAAQRGDLRQRYSVTRIQAEQELTRKTMRAM